MGFRLKVTSSEEISLNEKQIEEMEYKILTPEDSNARSTDLGTEIKVRGKIIPSIASAEGEPSIGLHRWSLVPAERLDSYRKAELSVVNAGVIVRKITIPNAFVVEYDEDFSDTTGNGIFFLHIRQKKDKITGVAIEGGYSE
ncbi:membrane-associated protease 1 [Lacrimispora amygdalina]|uniref:Membrane-associated protease 1 n=1 Tax=Lacrimispora amygdalina TaxID=253257 RepID=A0A3E2NFE0_9FIRM|nr:membrane-associated protease 1 [Clostridium indicum]RFZ79601.1 membrane-associated protease 1 [Clostridium indicum]